MGLQEFVEGNGESKTHNQMSVVSQDASLFNDDVD
jgi:hypothetical protein